MAYSYWQEGLSSAGWGGYTVSPFFFRYIMEDEEIEYDNPFDDDMYEEEWDDDDMGAAAIVSVNSLEEMYAEFEKFNARYSDVSYCLGIELDGKLTVHHRIGQPCYGEMRTYQPEIDKTEKPSDLHWPFPDGNPVALCVAMQHYPKHIVDWFIDGETSPWRKLFHDRTVRTFDGDNHTGFYLTNLDFDPTWLVDGLVMLKNVHYTSVPIIGKQIDPFYALILGHQVGVNNSGCVIPSYKVNSFGYFLPAAPSVKRMRNSDPVVEEGFWLSKRAPYRRKGMENVWFDKESKFHIFDDPRIKPYIGKPLNVSQIKEILIPIIDEACLG
jgi:hypothetical protein